MEGGAEHWSSQALMEVSFLSVLTFIGKTALYRALSDTTIYLPYSVQLYNHALTWMSDLQ